MDLREIFSGAMTRAKWMALGEYLAGSEIRTGPGILSRKVGNKILLRAKKNRYGSGGGGGGGPCPFGEIVRWTEGEGEEAETKTGIRGGVIYCGDKNFNIPHQELNLEADGEWLVWIPVECESNRDDDEEIILPGIKTGTKPEDDWEKIENDGENDYPDNEEPEVDDGLGTINIPIGILTIENGSPSIAPVACGNITIGQCGGVLSHTRG